MDRFIVSTGRSGSTILSRMVAQNSNVLVLSEFMAAMDQVYRFREGLVGGEDLAAIMSTSCEISTLIRQRGHSIEEVLTDAPSTLAHIVLPALTSEPDKLFEEVIEFARMQPPRLIADHYRVIFEWLCVLFKKDMWIERSGMTMRIMAGLSAAFPDARYLHISRDGPETALSMYNHPWYRVAINYDFEPPAIEEVIRALKSIGHDSSDPVSRYFSDDVPIERFGEHWSNVICEAYREIARMDGNQFHDLPFERLMTEPRAALRELADFFEIPDDPGWMDRASALLKSGVKKRVPELSEERQCRLRKACMPGQILLGRESPRRLLEAHRILRRAFDAYNQEIDINQVSETARPAFGPR